MSRAQVPEVDAEYLPWSTRPWNRCRAQTPEVHPAGDIVRCDLKRLHRTPWHRAERGMYHAVWTSSTLVVLPHDPSNVGVG